MDISTTIQECLAGNRLSQRKLYERFLPYALTVTRRFGVADRYRADVVQEIFSEVFTKLTTFDPNKAAFSTWFRTISVGKTVDFLRRREKLRLTELVAVIPEKEPTTAIEFDDIDNDSLFHALAALPTGFRAVFNLYAVDGYKHREIGKLLGISASASRSQYARARKQLRRHLDQTKKKLVAHESR